MRINLRDFPAFNPDFQSQEKILLFPEERKTKIILIVFNYSFLSKTNLRCNTNLKHLTLSLKLMYKNPSLAGNSVTINIVAP